MDILQALILGIVQGATEFLPISSSGHLVLVPWWLGWNPPGLVFDTTLHLGTIVAVIVYFYRDIIDIVIAWLRGLFGRGMTPKAWLGWWLILGTIPAAVLGFLLQDFFESMFGAPPVVAGLLVVTGIILAVSERLGTRRRALDRLNWSDAVIIGVGQAVAVAPGISRSGTTIAAGLLRGLRREEAARFSFLLSIPIIVGTGLVQLMHLVKDVPPTGATTLLVIGFAAAAVTGYLAIRFMLRYLQQRSLYPFAIYCWIAGVVTTVAALTHIV